MLLAQSSGTAAFQTAIPFAIRALVVLDRGIEIRKRFAGRRRNSTT
jgi:hypothetical protein